MGIAPVIAAAGICCFDYIVTSPRVEWGDTAWVTDFTTQGGGLAATAIVACARLGAECTLLSLLGDDEIGDTILAGLEVEEIATNSIVRVPGGHSPFSFIHVDEETGERTIFHRKATFPETELRVNISLAQHVDVLLVDDVYPSLAEPVAAVASRQGIPIVADLAHGPNDSAVIDYVDVLIAPRHFARDVGLENDPEKALRKIHELGPTTAVITLGADGYVWSDQTGSGKGAASKVQVVDTTSAGDAFHGAFCYGLALGWDTPRCCEFASAVAAIKCTRPGGRAGLPTMDETIQFLKERSKLAW